MSDKKCVALIGGAGFIGHNLAIELANAGHDPYCIDSLGINNFVSLSSTYKQVSNRELLKKIARQRFDLLDAHNIPLFIQDAREYHQLSHVLNTIKPDVIILLAAVAHADRSNKDPHNTFDHSLRTLENALDWAKSSVEHFIYFSSSMVYGNFPDGEVTEETPCEPLGIYAALKFAGEKIVTAYNQVFDLPYTIVRPSALYGERCISQRVGQKFIECAMQGESISINGDGSSRLDFTYIKDLCHGVCKVIETPESKGEIFNLTYGESRSIDDLASIIREHFPSIEINYLPKDKLMPDRGTLCVDKARQIIGYKPEYPVERGFVDYINWYKTQFKDTKW